MSIRPAALAGTWYPRQRGALEREVDGLLARAPEPPPLDVRAIVAPHAGMLFSGATAARAHKAAAGTYEVAVLVGPSHFVGFEGVAVYPDGAFESPLGLSPVDGAGVDALCAAAVARRMTPPHEREHSLEMQIPFLQRTQPGVSIVPVLMGYQRRETILALAAALAEAFAARRALLVASTDLSHYFDASKAAALDGQVQLRIEAFDPEGLLDLFEMYPERDRGRFVACGAGPAIAVMMAARALGSTGARVLGYSHSGDVSGDATAVVGYIAAAMGVTTG
jgi:AmmeMemoRadiSam system protein B